MLAWENQKLSLDSYKYQTRCGDQHWDAYSSRLQAKYVPAPDSVGHMETVAEDAKRFLQLVGAWEKF